MKRVISLLLCLILACGMLVSCGETEIGKHAASLKEQFYIPPEEKISLKLYIVYDDADSGALTEVERRINAMTESKYNTKLDVVYLTEAEYDNAVAAAAAANENAIVLITGKDMVDSLYGAGDDIVVTELFDTKQATKDAPIVKVVTTYSSDGTVTVKKYDKEGKEATATEADNAKIPVSRQVSVGHLEDLSEYVLKTDAKYGLLNAKIAASLMDSAMKGYTVDNADYSGLFAIPNNRLIGDVDGYKYVKINRQVCEIWLNHTEEYLRSIDTAEEIAALQQEVLDLLPGCDPKDYVDVVDGNYATKAEVEAGEKFIMNIQDQPLVTAEDAFSGAFAVLKGTDVERAMRIIYAINMDSDLHNLLQYGIKDTNYELNDDGVAIEKKETEGKKYIMNPLYTGNLFSVHYSETWGWTAEVKAYAEAQNLAADRYYAEMKAAAAQPNE